MTLREALETAVFSGKERMATAVVDGGGGCAHQPVCLSVYVCGAGWLAGWLRACVFMCVSACVCVSGTPCMLLQHLSYPVCFFLLFVWFVPGYAALLVAGGQLEGCWYRCQQAQVSSRHTLLVAWSISAPGPLSVH